MDGFNGISVKWTVEGESFRFVSGAGPATLSLPDGRDVELSLRGWRALAAVLAVVAAEPGGAPEPRVPAPIGRRGHAWDEAEEARAKAAFLAGDDVADIARSLTRSRGAVMARLVKLGLVEESGAGLRYPTRPAAQ